MHWNSAASSGGRFVDIVQLRSSVQDGVTGPISGELVAGNFTASDFSGSLEIEQMSDLLEAILDGNVYVRVQTLNAPLGEIVGQIMLAGDDTEAMGANATDTNATAAG
jgi:hypothetical protein